MFRADAALRAVAPPPSAHRVALWRRARAGRPAIPAASPQRAAGSWGSRGGRRRPSSSGAFLAPFLRRQRSALRALDDGPQPHSWLTCRARPHSCGERSAEISWRARTHRVGRVRVEQVERT